jgi:hypothetical protein
MDEREPWHIYSYNIACKKIFTLDRKESGYQGLRATGNSFMQKRKRQKEGHSLRSCDVGMCGPSCEVMRS